MVTFQKTDNPDLLSVVCSDGIVVIDRRVYEHKLGTLLSCETKEQVFEIATNCQEYLTQNYKTEIIAPCYI